MEECLYLQVFSEFCLRSARGEIDSKTIHSRQLTKLLLFILIHRRRTISHQELINVLWEESTIENPLGALKNLIYRLRQILAQLGDGEYILGKRGSYQWNPEISLESDYERFENLCSKAKTIRAPEEKISVYKEAVALYTGNIMEEIASERWMVSVSTWYQSIYLAAAKELVSLYAENKDFGNIQKLCVFALKIDELDEDFHYWLIRSLAEQNKLDLARKHYNEATRLFQKYLGVRKSEKLQQVYIELIAGKNGKTTLDGKTVLKDLQETAHGEGVCFCEFAVFREIYRVETRKAIKNRKALAVPILLFTMNSVNICHETEESKQHSIQTGMEHLEEVLRRCLHTGDVVSRCGGNQFLVLLNTFKEEDMRQAGRRMRESFFTKFGTKKVSLLCELLTEKNQIIIIE